MRIMANLIVRIPESLHAVARVAAATRAISLNAWICQAIEAAVDVQARAPGGEPIAAAQGDAARPRKGRAR